tara:strand:- start:314 stop:967 length:654 start_codon:yes stop_codon:yes gene_type:complete
VIVLLEINNMKSLNQAFAIIAIFTFSSCAQIFQTPDAEYLAQIQEVVAVLPPTVSIQARMFVDSDSMKEQQRTESMNIQKEMYSWLLRRKMQGKIFQEILDVETTNAKLLKAGYPENPLTVNELCDVLGVDGVISSNYNMTNPMSNFIAMNIQSQGGGIQTTNQINVTISIQDCEKKKMIWNYSHTFNGSIGSTTGQLIDNIMRHSSKRMPYVLDTK